MENADRTPSAAHPRRTGRLARFAHRHDRCRKLMWRLGLIPNVLGPFYRRGV